MVEAEFVLGGLETVLDGPPPTPAFSWRALDALGGEESKFAIGNIATNKKSSRPPHPMPGYVRCDQRLP